MLKPIEAFHRSMTLKNNFIYIPGIALEIPFINTRFTLITG
jgi:hypothetical protein